MKQNKVAAKEGQIFFSGRAKKNKVVGKESLFSSNFILFRFTKEENLFLVCSNFILFRFTAEEDLSFFCSNSFHVSFFYDNNIYFPFAVSASYHGPNQIEPYDQAARSEPCQAVCFIIVFDSRSGPVQAHSKLSTQS